jgi:hypothetical protein
MKSRSMISRKSKLKEDPLRMAVVRYRLHSARMDIRGSALAETRIFNYRLPLLNDLGRPGVDNSGVGDSMPGIYALFDPAVNGGDSGMLYVGPPH